MPKSTHYTPPLSRFHVCALYHEAKARGIPMTQLANNLIEAGLRESPGWKEAQAQQEAMRLREGLKEYQTK
jgi:hypothetical protein